MNDLPNAWVEAAETLKKTQSSTSQAISNCEYWLGKFLTVDPAMLKLKDAARMVCFHPNINTVFITGPSGHGKELFARACSFSSSAPFIPINCAALPDTLITSLLFGHVKGTFTGATEDRPGVFEAAGSGTVFLDEIGDMPPNQQAALLRVIQEREVTRLGSSSTLSIKCRIVAATNSPEKLRHDLFGRLMGIHLAITPLLERPEDIDLICQSLHLDPAVQTTPHFSAGITLYGVRYLQALQQRQLIGL